MKPYTPTGHNSVSPYLLVKDVNGLIKFLAATFSASVLYKAENTDGSVKHAEVKVDDSVIMMGERPNADMAVICSVHVYVPDVDACYRRALDAGAAAIAEPKDQPYGDRSAGVKDAEGNFWWIGTHLQS